LKERTELNGKGETRTEQRVEWEYNVNENRVEGEKRKKEGNINNGSKLSTRMLQPFFSHRRVNTTKSGLNQIFVEQRLKII
jgi:hypothetical protein